MDWQKYSQAVSARIANAERSEFTGQIELRIQYRNRKPRRGHVREVNCRVLNREPIMNSVEHPELEFSRLAKKIFTDGPNADAEISILYSFFLGSVVDIRREVLNIMC